MTRHGNVANSSSLQAIGDKIAQKRLIIWDFDGTFCDTEPIHFEAYRRAFEPYGHEVREDEYYIRFTQYSDGLRLEVEAYGLGLDEATRKSIREDKKSLYSALISEGRAAAFPEIAPLVEELMRLGVDWMIASNSDALEIKGILRQLGAPFGACLDVVGPAPGLRKKPAGDIFVESLKRAGVKADEALVIEDTAKGLAAAREAGVDALMVRTRYNGDLVPEEPHLARLRHGELLDLFRGLSKAASKA